MRANKCSERPSGPLETRLSQVETGPLSFAHECLHKNTFIPTYMPLQGCFGKYLSPAYQPTDRPTERDRVACSRLKSKLSHLFHSIQTRLDTRALSFEWLTGGSIAKEKLVNKQSLAGGQRQYAEGQGQTCRWAGAIFWVGRGCDAQK